MRLKKRIKHTLVFHLTRFIIFFINILPRNTALFFGSTLGLTAWAFSTKERHRTNRHLHLALGEKLSPSQRYTTGRTFFINSGRNLIDVIRFKKYYKSEIKPKIEIEGLEHFDRAYQRGNGLIGVTGHLGNFELLAVHIAALGYQIAVIGREMYDTRIDKYLVDSRTAMGLTNFSTKDSPRKPLTWLKEGKALGVLIDTDSSRVRSTFLPVFGRLAQTPIGQTILGMRTGAAFVPMACLRTENNNYKIIVKPEIQYDLLDKSDENTRNLTLQCSQAVEDMIKENLSQWIWIHNRWCARPVKSA